MASEFSKSDFSKSFLSKKMCQISEQFLGVLGLG